mmetsp:Transcript_4883/g.10139  ORF Transcript_4883/g.10139 Transcript_4883/m.10139 type:complete len:214 (-) Transcript_4883:1118-1759(-)
MGHLCLWRRRLFCRFLLHCRMGRQICTAQVCKGVEQLLPIHTTTWKIELLLCIMDFCFSIGAITCLCFWICSLLVLVGILNSTTFWWRRSFPPDSCSLFDSLWLCLRRNIRRSAMCIVFSCWNRFVLCVFGLFSDVFAIYLHRLPRLFIGVVRFLIRLFLGPGCEVIPSRWEEISCLVSGRRSRSVASGPVETMTIVLWLRRSWSERVSLLPL